MSKRRYLDGTLVVKTFGQPVDPFASACRDSAKANLSIEGSFASNGSIFLPAANFSDVVVGSRFLPEAVEAALALVRVGQRASIFSSSSRMRDDVGRFPFGEALRADVRWSVMCYSVIRPSKMSLEERMEATRVRKEWGNELFRSGLVEDALDKYEVAYNVIRPQILTGNSEQQAISPRFVCRVCGPRREGREGRKGIRVEVELGGLGLDRAQADAGLCQLC